MQCFRVLLNHADQQNGLRVRPCPALLPVLVGGLVRVKIVGKNGLRQVEFFPHIAKFLRCNGGRGTFADLVALKCDLTVLMILKLLHTIHKFTENIAFSHVSAPFLSHSARPPGHRAVVSCDRLADLYHRG